MFAVVSLIISVLVAAYSYYQAQKAQKKARPEQDQINGTITGEGTISHDIAGSPHMYGNDVDLWNFSTKSIKKKGGK